MSILARLRTLWCLSKGEPVAPDSTVSPVPMYPTVRGLCAFLPGEPCVGLVAYRRPDGMWVMNTVGVTDPEAAEQLYCLADAMTDRVFDAARARKARKG